MGFKWLTYCLLMLLKVTFGNTSLELQQVVLFHRHGARSSLRPYPTNNFETKWPQGTGQLTQLGMQQMSLLGEFIKGKYGTLINTTYYIREQIHIQSTDVDRTLMSAESLLAGLYPPQGHQMWEANIHWQPIPVHTIPLLQDPLSLTEHECSRYDMLLDEFEQTELFQRKNSSWESEFDYMLQHTGLSPPMSIDDAWNVWDTLYCEETQGIEGPPWKTEELMTLIPGEMIPFYYIKKYGTPEKVKLRGGTQLYQLQEVLEGYMNTSLTNRMHIYSVHDDNLIALKFALNVYDNKIANYSTAVIFELYHDSKLPAMGLAANGWNGYFVRVLAKDETYSNKTKAYAIPGCTEFCPYLRFKTLLETVTLSMEDRATSCEAQNNKGFYIALGVGLVILLIIIAAVAFISCRFIAASNQVDSENSSESSRLVG